MDDSFSPWANYFNDAAVVKKLDNFAFLNCNLHIRVLINASPFYYSAARVSYLPLVSYEAGDVDASAPLGLQTVLLSQRPGFWFYPQTSVGGDMVLPFIYHKNWLDVTVNNDFIEMGTINIMSPINLANANSVVGSDVDIQVYAWAENVKLAGPTVSLSLQGGDEYGSKGVISTPASAIAKATGLLGSIPIIGPYMTATSMAADAVSNIAAWFGYTNVPVISDVQPYKSMPFHSFSSAEIGQPIEKLSLDPKNEVTIDPRVTGCEPADPMIISDLVQRESYLTNFTWAHSDLANAQLFGIRVNPIMLATEAIATGTGYDAIYKTPMAHFSQLFKYWRGDIVFRFRVIASQYHRGRMRITWDPVGDINTNGVNSNITYNKIVDITADGDVTMVIPYLQAKTWAVVSNDPVEINYGATAPARRELYDNGTLSVRVFTQSTSPVATADIQVLVSVMAGENFELAAPTELATDQSFFIPQGQDEFGDAWTSMYNKTPANPNNDLIHMGETIVSLRQLLRRSCLSRVLCAESDTTSSTHTTKSRMSRYPLTYGYDPNGIHTADKIITVGSTSSFNFVNPTPITHCAPCFLGARGSMNWHFNAASATALPSVHIARSRINNRSVPNWNTFDASSTVFNQDVKARDILYNAMATSGASGQSLVNQLTQTGFSVVAPYYSRFRMQKCNASNTVLGSSVDSSNSDNLELHVTSVPVAGQNPRDAPIYMYNSIGTDFSFIFFVNVPMMYSYSSTPLAD
eukprot:GHVU01009637.1.p1 GENE.GHVU01009637.1~~GHVU01009637.1.p1  ORF type:complete len:764 (-),score=14.23 GHVU01009637.1:69-2312(-)